jgi:hypothetical protein
MSTDFITQLKTLKLYGMAEAWADLQAETPRLSPMSPEELLRRLVQAETTERQARSLRYQLTVAKFPIHRDLLHFDCKRPTRPPIHVKAKMI